jgi:sulfite exporter TauE/SafE
MNSRLERYKRYIFLGIIIIALGVTFSVNMKDEVGSLGTVFIAVGGLFFIIGMSMKNKEGGAK